MSFCCGQTVLSIRRGGSTPRPSSLINGRPQNSAHGLPSPIRAEHTTTLPASGDCKGAGILVQHLDTLVHHTPLFLKAVLLTSAKVTVFLARLHLLSTGAGFPLTIMTSSLVVGASLRSSIEVYVGITFQDGDRFNSCQVIYSQFGLAIHQNDHQERHRFVEWTQNEIAVVPDFHKRILFSDEAHFWLNGYVNKQNCRIWRETNPQVYVETPLHPEKLTVWCAL
ncbi:DUF4817 domain-containing protein [Trichonephila clavipes]|nr:DUF4817 domain-containing protein [Trichonephila clavipes]